MVSLLMSGGRSETGDGTGLDSRSGACSRSRSALTRIGAKIVVRRHSAIIAVSSESRVLRLKTFGGLWIENREANSPSARPRSLALLAICAAAGAKGVSRERVLGILWPESHPERARHALSRRSIVSSAILELRSSSRPRKSINHSRPQPHRERHRRFSERRARRAVGGRGGPIPAPVPRRFLPRRFPRIRAMDRLGAVIPRGRRRSRGAGCGGSLRVRRQTRRGGRIPSTADAELNPGNSRFAAQYIEALADRGDRAGALAHGKAHLELLQRDFDLDPDAELEQLIARLRESPPPTVQATGPPTHLDSAESVPTQSAEPAQPAEPAVDLMSTIATDSPSVAVLNSHDLGAGTASRSREQHSSH